MSCEEIFRNISRFLDGDLPEGEMLELGAHIDACGHCAAELAFERTLLHRLAALLRAQQLPPAFADRVIAFLAQRCPEFPAQDPPRR